ncbi:RIB43A-like with coiled-coils protein 2 isoform X1 [Cimex lectularius]|uniref:RIB43A-like with coiled-coils protein 2 n=1 Tax=Cimex lectularius TaxID=79782 RepID=A0A8I6SIY8_CIMLE|nr:RIB43A-like with coiled-coils protein 2 isoform X1 [Cimex lectularius]
MRAFPECEMPIGHSDTKRTLTTGDDQAEKFPTNIRRFQPTKTEKKVDVDVLERQIQEKNERKRKEEIEKKMYELRMKSDIDEANYREYIEKMDKRKQLMEINSFRNIHQKKELRREYDLDNPNKTSDGRMHLRNDDKRWGVQIFEGEDDFLNQRRAYQKLQQRNWLIQQMVEHELEKSELKKAQLAFEQHMKDRDNVAVALQEMEQCCKRKLDQATAEYNKALATRKLAERYDEMTKTLQDNEIDIFNAVSSDLLTENAELARSALGPNRYNTMMFKGMSQKQIAEIKHIQLQQIAEAKARKEREALEEQYWQRYNDQTNKIVGRIDQETNNAMKTLHRNLTFQNKRLEEEQKLQKKYLDKIVFSNEATSEFFEQFNKSSR